ncbi:MAG: hypothetical protein KAS59_08555, partial [Alphaproteobacteria bacterium]|nr:hypothetical protein [Alphaproteobacteria bacterium]
GGDKEVKVFRGGLSKNQHFSLKIQGFLLSDIKISPILLPIIFYPFLQERHWQNRKNIYVGVYAVDNCGCFK